MLLTHSIKKSNKNSVSNRHPATPDIKQAHLLAHVDSLASLAFGDVQSLGQLGKLIVDLHLLKPSPVRRQPLVQRNGVPL